MGPNTVEKLRTVPFPYLLITAKTIEAETVSVSDIENIKIVC